MSSAFVSWAFSPRWICGRIGVLEHAVFCEAEVSGTGKSVHL